MIFVTVGTHEQPFDRLIQQVDALCADGTLTEEEVKPSAAPKRRYR